MITLEAHNKTDLRATIPSAVTRSKEEAATDLWVKLLTEIEVDAATRTASSYALAAEKLARLRCLAIETAACTRFNDVLCALKHRHQTKSMLISKIDRFAPLI